MDIKGIREAIRQQPFQPFTLRLTDGRGLFIKHPDYLVVSPDNRRIVAFVPPDDAMVIIEPLLVVSMDFQQPQQAST